LSAEVSLAGGTLIQSMYCSVAGGDSMKTESRCVHCGALRSIRDLLKEGRYCSPQCAEMNAKKYVS
jgi:hypothetical protein